MNVAATEPAQYRYGDSARPGVVLGLGLRQSAPLLAGALWLTVFLALGAPVIGSVGPLVGAVLAFGRWRGAPLHDVAQPAVRLLARQATGRSTWTPTGLRGPDARRGDVPDVLRGIEIDDVAAASGVDEIGVIRDRNAGTVSMVLRVVGTGFPVASLREQDALVGSWGATLAPFARARCPVSRVTWQEWCRPVGVEAHRAFLDEVGGPSGDRPGRDYDDLLAGQAAMTISHDVLVTVTVELARVWGGRRVNVRERVVEALQDERRQFVSRLETAGMKVAPPLKASEVCAAVRERADPSNARPPMRTASLAAAVGRDTPEWGPMAVQPSWDEVRVDGSFHRSYRVVAWPMLAVTADWMAPLLAGDAATRTVTVVMEPVALRTAAIEANRHLTSIEADQQQKERHGFRLTARERRRHADVEAREQELASGHPEFRHAAFVTVTAPSVEELDEAAARVEQAAAQAMLDIRSLVARQDQGWVASLPLGRSATDGGST